MDWNPKISFSIWFKWPATPALLNLMMSSLHLANSTKFKKSLRTLEFKTCQK
jgi:hypothetical protein